MKQTIVRIIQFLVLLLCPMATVLHSDHISASSCRKDQLGTLSKAWQQGNLIILQRHTERCSDEHPCEREFGLTLKGFEQADDIHRSLATLGRRGFDMYYSPSMRTRATAWMIAPMAGHSLELARTGCKEDFLEKLSDLKKPGRNLLVVTHSHCLNELSDSSGMRLLDFNAGDEAFFGVGIAFDASSPAHVPIQPAACSLPGRTARGETL